MTVFSSRVNAYVDLRDRLEAGLPRRASTSSASDASSMQRALAARIQKARAKAKQGELCSAAIALEIKKSVRRVMHAHTWKVIMDDNPGELPSQVSVQYQEGSPLTTMPPNVLAALPRLPADMEHRFVERHLILLDTRARLIVDRIPFAIVEPDGEGSCR